MMITFKSMNACISCTGFLSFSHNCNKNCDEDDDDDDDDDDDVVFSSDSIIIFDIGNIIVDDEKTAMLCATFMCILLIR